jgi:hypothetical protein
VHVAASLGEYYLAGQAAVSTAGFAAPFSLAAAANATDNFYAGINQLWTGVPQQTAKNKILTAGFGSTVAAYAEPVVNALFDFGAANRVLASSEMLPALGRTPVNAAPNRIQWVDEIQTKYGHAQDYEDAAFGARSNVSTGLRQSPALPYNNPNPNGSNVVKFDGVDPYDPRMLIDRKLNVSTAPGQIEDLQRQAAVLKQNRGYQLRIEVPTEAAARNANKALNKAGVGDAPITVKVVPSP